MKMELLSFVVLCCVVEESWAITREYNIAAVELEWDYLHSDRLDSPPPQSRHQKSLSPSKDGPQKYMKATYWEYTDSTFSTPISKPPWMGIQGPTIKAEINDVIVVHFKNFASRPFSVHPIGISYWKQSEGAGYSDETCKQEKGDDSVSPGAYYRYVWEIMPSNGPTLGDPDCLIYSYSSQVDTVRDFNSGLIGALFICKAGLKLCLQKPAVWHLIGMGTSPQIHSIHFQDHTLQVEKHRKMALDMTPMTFTTAEMKPVAIGKFLISCQIHSHLQAGMNAYFTVESCPEELKKRKVTQDPDYSDDYTLEDMLSNVVVMNPELNVRSAKPKPRRWVHYIAAQEVMWDYIPNFPGERERVLSTEFLEKGPLRIGKQYKKAIYKEYEDKTFTKQKPTQDKGLVGPVLRGEVEDEFEIVFKNLASRPFNIYPNGLSRVQSLVGKVLLKGKDLKSYAVQPNETFTYLWTITAEDGPTKADPRCLTRLYKSTIDPVRDIASGLMGPLVICYRKTLDKRGNVVTSDRERHLMFSIFDENKSWYINENIQKYIKAPSSIDPTDADFYKSNLMYTVNGYMYNNLRFKDCLGNVAFWHVVNVGTQSDFLSVYFTGNTFERDKVYETVLTLFPMAGETVSMELETLGEWEIGSLDSNYKNRGMSAKYSVHKCESDDSATDGDIFYEDYNYDNIFAPRGTGKNNRTMAIRVCKKKVIDNSLSARDNATASSKPDCYIVTVRDRQGERTEAFSPGDIPLDILQEIEDSNTTMGESQEKHSTKRKERSLAADEDLTLLLTPAPFQIPETDTRDGGSPLLEDDESEEEQKELLANPVILINDTNVTLSSLRKAQGTTHSAQQVILKLVDRVRKIKRDEGSLQQSEGKNNESLNPDTSQNTVLATEVSKNTNQKGKVVKAALDPKLYEWLNKNMLLKRETRGESKPEDKKPPDQQHDKNVLKFDYSLSQENVSQAGKMQENPDGIVPNFQDTGNISEGLNANVNLSESANVSSGEPMLDYDDYNQEEINGTSHDVYNNEGLGLRSLSGKPRNFYIAAIEMLWDYGVKKPQQLIKPREMRRGYQKFFTLYKKVVFREYLDSSFTQQVVRGEMEEHLGILGPVIRAEVNDVITVTFKNLATRPYAFHFHGVYDRTAQGQSNTLGEEYEKAVKPNEVRTYSWKVTKRQGPSDSEFDCKAWAYYSNFNKEKDIHSGLIGPLLICRPQTLNSQFEQQLSIPVFSLLFMVFDETKSWYMDDNIKMFCTPPCQIRRNDPIFVKGNTFSAINGYVAETLPGLVVEQHHPVRWHLLNMGSDGEIHAVHFHGNPFTVRRDQERRMSIYNLYPGVFGMVEMRPSMAGTWLIECMIGDYQLSGMRAKMLVYNPKCAEPLGMKSKRIADSQITESDHYDGWESKLARLDLSGSVNAWTGVNKMSWIQVDLLEPMLIHRILTQGVKHSFSESFISHFIISYSLDSDIWKLYKGNGTKSKRIFGGNVDGSQVKVNYFSPPIIARYIKLHPVSSVIKPTLRMELIGCDLNSCSMPMGMENGRIPKDRISASSFSGSWLSSWYPWLARLNSDARINAWRPKVNNPHEWLQVDFQSVKRITGIITQGAKEIFKYMMVTEFIISVSSDGENWFAVQDETSSRQKVFQGNKHHYYEQVLNTFDPPLFTRYIRIYPKGWNNDIALRVEFLGCDTQQ
ncbi:coagulation factor VIII isoform X2 [Amia ocellicauda]|uniref:coagulation factor VIII isoform X2 n=1 Tax=Amia ocellicauda TaxID=2972642 RepID=UPI003464E837